MKFALGGAAMAALLMVLAIQRLPGEARVVVEKPAEREARFDAAWAEGFQTAVQAKADREPIRQIDIARPVIASTDPKPVPTERIVSPPAAMPPVIPIDDDPPPVRRKRERYANAAPTRGGDICTRHHLRKIVTRGGKSWRCGR